MLFGETSAEIYILRSLSEKLWLEDGVEQPKPLKMIGRQFGFLLGLDNGNFFRVFAVKFQLRPVRERIL